MRRIEVEKDGSARLLFSDRPITVNRALGRPIFIHRRANRSFSADVHATSKELIPQRANAYCLSNLHPLYLKDIDNHTSIEYEHAGYVVQFYEVWFI